MNPEQKLQFTITFWGWRFFPVLDRKKLNHRFVQSLIKADNIKGFISYINSIAEKESKEETENVISQIKAGFEEERKFYLKCAKQIIDQSENPKKDLRELKSLFNYYNLTEEINQIFKQTQIQS